MVREVSESCVQSFMAEIVASYCRGFYANKPKQAAPRIEAIGFQVDHQLAERRKTKYGFEEGRQQGTQIYDEKADGWRDLGMLDVMQIFGRAGRSQFDKSGEGIIITTHDKLAYYL